MLLAEHAAMNDEEKKEPAERNVRAYIDIANMLGWINFLERKKPRKDRRWGSVAQIVDKLLREDVVDLYEPIEKDVLKMAKALGLEPPPGQTVPKSPGRG